MVFSGPIFYRSRPQRKKYSWELEKEILKQLDGIEVIYESVTSGEEEKNSLKIKYDYKKNKNKS